MSIRRSDLARELCLQFRLPSLAFFHEENLSLLEFICVPTTTSSTSPDDTISDSDAIKTPSDTEFLYCLLARVHEIFLDNQDIVKFKCHAGIHYAIQDFLESFELLFTREQGVDTSGCNSTFSGSHRTLHALFRHKPTAGRSHYYRKNYFTSIFADIKSFEGLSHSPICSKDGKLRIVFDVEKLFFGTNLVNCLGGGDIDLSTDTVATAFQHGRKTDVPDKFQDLSISASVSLDPSHLTLEVDEPSPAARTNHFHSPLVGLDDLSSKDDAVPGAHSHPSKKKRDSLPGTQFKKISLLDTSKPLPGCRSHESERFKKDFHCSRESLANLDLYGVDDHGERWSVLVLVGATKIEPSHKRNAVATPTKQNRILFTAYNYCKAAVARGIYVPFPHLISPDCIMGMEYVSCALPDSIYQKFHAMDVALLEDLRHLFKLNPAICSLLLQHTSGYQAFHAILVNCCQVYRPAPPRSNLCIFDCEKTSISSYALNIIEYLLECTVAKENNLSLYSQFLRFVEGFPPAARACLVRHADTLFLQDHRFDKVNNIPSQLHPDQWALYASTTLRRDGISLRSASLPSKQLNISSLHQGKPRVFQCRACGSNEHLWASCPHVEIKVTDPTAKKRLLDSIPKGNIRVLSTGEDDLADPTNDDITTVVDNTTAADDDVGHDPSENNDSFDEDQYTNDDTAFENMLDEGIITSIGQEYLDEEYDGTIGAEFLIDIPSRNAFVATSIPFCEVFPDAQLESGEEAVSSVPICQHCRSSGHSVDDCLLLSVDPTIVRCSSIDTSNVMSLSGAIQSSFITQSLSSSSYDFSSGFGAALPSTITVTNADSFTDLDNTSVLHILHATRFALLHSPSEFVSSMISSIGPDITSFRESSSKLQHILHPCTPFAFLNAIYSNTVLRKIYKPHIGSSAISDSMSVLALKLEKIGGDAVSLLSSTQSRSFRSWRNKVVRALDDTGADDNTTNIPYILHDLRLLPRQDWLLLRDAGGKLHLSIWGGDCYCKLCDGSMKKILMRFTPTLPVTVVDLSKFRNPTKSIASESRVYNHSTSSYTWTMEYTDGTVESLPLTKSTDGKTERYYSPPFAPVSSDIADKYESSTVPAVLSHVTKIASISNVERRRSPRLAALASASDSSPRVTIQEDFTHIDASATKNSHSSTAKVPSDAIPSTSKIPASSPSSSLTDAPCPLAPTFASYGGRLRQNHSKAIKHAPPVSRFNKQTTQLLWHFRLSHLFDHKAPILHQISNGIPRIHAKSALDKCSSCMQAKVHKAVKLRSEFHSIDDIRNDPNVKFFQHLFIDWGFIVGRSKNEDRFKRLQSFDGETCYLAVECVKSYHAFVYPSDSKQHPLLWLQFLLLKLTPWDRGDRTFRFDGDGDCDEFMKLLQGFGYRLETTGGDNSSANSIIERFHRTAKTNILSCIFACGWTMKAWALCLRHLCRLWNLLPHGKLNVVPYTFATGRLPNFAPFRIFGCPVVMVKTGNTDIDRNFRTGRFVGFDSSTKKFLVKVSTQKKPLETAHAQFDETFSSFEKLPPCAVQLRHSLGHAIIPDNRRLETCSIDFDVIDNNENFGKVFQYEFHPSSDSVHGFILATDLRTGRGFVDDVITPSLASTVPSWRKVLPGSFICRVNDVIVFTVEDITAALARCMSLSSFSITFCNDILDPLSRKDVQSKGLLKWDLDQLRFISSIIAETGEDVPSRYNRKCVSAVASIAVDPSGLATEADVDPSFVSEHHFSIEIDEFSTVELDGSPIDDDGNKFCRVNNVSQISSSSMFTRRQLKQRPDFDEWRQAEFEQLDDMDNCNMFGKVVRRSDLTGLSYDVIRAVWSYRIKLHSQRKKARYTGDGSKIKPKSKLEHKTYSACASHTGIRMTVAIAAIENRKLRAMDAINAYAQSGPLSKPCYMIVCEVFQEWYLERHSVRLEIGMLVELLSSIQGHHESGPNWQTVANDALRHAQCEPIIHEPCLYINSRTKDITVRQVDDFLTAFKKDDDFELMVKQLKEKINIEPEDDLCTSYNGIEIAQWRECIGMHGTKYITALVERFGWSSCNSMSKASLAPLTQEMYNEIKSGTHGPLAGSDEGKALCSAVGFGYRQLLGALIFIGVTVRVDICFSLSLLSRYAEYPAAIHYRALKRVAIYLRETKDWCLLFWRIDPMEELPPCPHKVIPSPKDSAYMYPANPLDIGADVDASHANDINSMRSTGGHNIMMAGAAVLWSSKLQSVVATSSTQGEFMQAVTCCKAVKYCRHIASELERPMSNPSPINEDNKACIMMVNQGRPTDRTRHLAIQWFAIQEWKQNGDIEVFYVPSADNSADNNTKGLSVALHQRHARRAMGHYGSPYATFIDNNLVTRSQD